VLSEHMSLAGPHTARDNGMYTGKSMPAFPRQINDISDMVKLKECLDGYDCGIRYMDEYIGRILDALKAKGVLEETAIIVTSDHGENFGELGMYSEHGTADNITCRIPMIVKWPGGLKGHVDRELRYNLDLAPTVSELLETKPWDNWTGESYAGTLRNGSKDGGRSELIISQNAHVCQRSVRWDDWIYIRTYHDGYHPHFEDEMLFNACTFANDRGNAVACGIYGDEPYASEPNATTIALHGDDEIIIDAGDLSGIVLNGGHGSDLVTIAAAVQLLDTNLSGGDDRSITDGFVDRLVFDGWVGDLNGSQLQNWETIVFDNGSEITFLDDNVTAGYETGSDPVSSFSYGLVLQNDA